MPQVYMSWGIFFSLKHLMNIPELHTIFLQSSGISTDTRTLKHNNLFFALQGDNFNGNVYAETALKEGAFQSVIDDPTYYIEGKTICVNNVLQTLQDLARYHRNYLGIPILALTGSNGKTTTKELITAVLSKKYTVSATQGNLNNHIGVPLTLLNMNEQTKMGVVEMGANHLGEIQMLSEIAQPDYGYITNFGKAHLEGFGSVEGVIQGKSELYDYLIRTDGMLFINADDPTQVIKSKKGKSYSFSERDDNDLQITYTVANPYAQIIVGNTTISSQLIGQYNTTNIAAAVAIGSYCGVHLTDIASAIAQYIPNNNRSQIIERDDKTIILDAYNANPTSMEAALKNFSNLEKAYKIAFLGDMFELGSKAHNEHQFIVNLVEQLNIKAVYLGEHFKEVLQNTNQLAYKNFKEFKERGLPQKIQSMLAQRDVAILIKGSRGMALERILELLE